MARNFAVKKVRKQMYPATYNFMDEVDGTTDTDIEFISSIGGTDTGREASIIALEDGHRKIIKFISDGDNGTSSQLYHTGLTETGTTVVEIWLKYIDHGQGSLFVQLRNEGNTAITSLLLHSGGNLVYAYYGNGIGGNNNVSTAIASDTWFHYRIEINHTTDLQSVWIDGVNKFTAQNLLSDTVSTSLSSIYIWNSGGGGVNSLEYYIDAIGFSWDTDYAIGDDIHPKHLKDQDSDFESEDVGTTGTSIGFVDFATVAADTEIVAEYNEHKKIIKQTNIGGNSLFYAGITQSKAATVEWWAKAAQVNKSCPKYLREDGTVLVNITFHTDGTIYAQNNAAFPTILASYSADTWYHFKVQYYADDTFDVWIDNILVADGYTFAAAGNQVAGINRIYGRAYDGTMYMDAISTDATTGNEIADNRTFDYNDTYTREDITDKILNITYENKYFAWRKASLFSDTEYTKTEVFFQIHDINSKLTMEGEIKQAIWNGAVWLIPLRDKNYDGLHNRSSNTFAANKIHDPTDSTSILKVILPNVSHSDGRLLLVNADTKTDTYSPVTKNYPDIQILLDITDIADSPVIIKPSGKSHLDDDLASGSALDYDTAADRDYFIGDPLMINLLEDYNYFEIFGAWNPETGTRFTKAVDNTGSDQKHPFRITNNDWQSQTDVDAYAAKIAASTIDVLQITVPLQSMGTHNMGETFDYKFVNTEYTIPQANYYIVSEKMNMDKGTSTLILSEGLMEESKYAATYERPENYSDSDMSEIYETDLVIINPNLEPWVATTYGAGAGGTYGWVMNAVNEGIITHFYIDEKVDDTRVAVVIITFTRDDANNDAFDVWVRLREAPTDLSAAWNTLSTTATEVSASVAGREGKLKITIAASDLEPEYDYEIAIYRNDARDLTFHCATVRYYTKRSL